MGLSYARNVGAHAALGEVFAYTDSDCMADPDWLYYMICTLISGDYVGVGGPNISPPAVNWIQAAVSACARRAEPRAADLSCVIAEHIPGCNMAFHRAAFYSVGGFDPEYRKAGDDVDYCWRLQNNGGVIAFLAELDCLALPPLHAASLPQATGRLWRGGVDAALQASHFLRTHRYCEVEGPNLRRAAFHLAAQPADHLPRRLRARSLPVDLSLRPRAEIAAYVSSIEWVVLTGFIAVLGLPWEKLRIVPPIMFGATFLVALSYMLHARIERKLDTVFARLLVVFLRLYATARPRLGALFHLAQVQTHAARGYCDSWRSVWRPPVAVSSITKLDFWNETGQGREQLLTEIFALLETEGWRYSSDTGWKDWGCAGLWQPVLDGAGSDRHGISWRSEMPRRRASVSATRPVATTWLRQFRLRGLLCRPLRLFRSVAGE